MSKRPARQTNKGKKLVTTWQILPYPKRIRTYEKAPSLLERSIGFWLLVGTLSCSATVYLGSTSKGLSANGGQTISAEQRVESNTNERLEVSEATISAKVIVATKSAEVKKVSTKKKMTKQQIEQLIRESFEESPNTAVAVAYAESGLNPTQSNKGRAGTLWPTYKGECSIGIFQINLASDGCRGKGVHWNKVPGDSLAEKIAWLEEPENNITLAKEIHKNSGWNAWGGYTSGNWRKHL